MCCGRICRVCSVASQRNDAIETNRRYGTVRLLRSISGTVGKMANVKCTQDTQLRPLLLLLTQK